MKNVLCITLIFVICSPCRELMADQVAVYFPVTKHCANYTESYLLEINQQGFNAKYQKFLVPLMELESVAGFIELSSDSMTKRELLGLWLNYKKLCYANAAITTVLDRHGLNFLENEIGVSEILGASVKDSRLTIYYRDELVK